ncbi:hypothetical protein PVAP13_1NG303719 [Panicum virgatum]|uniref:Uncharacterized protein n=1 Tax=Panicum virgatum TaxID=38727 RepID=A0A8T0X6L8_PANVG|nr:hypothetical protein PVAP13_1NG303719 [Panicum virgatum]
MEKRRHAHREELTIHTHRSMQRIKGSPWRYPRRTKPALPAGETDHHAAHIVPYSHKKAKLRDQGRGQRGRTRSNPGRIPIALLASDSSLSPRERGPTRKRTSSAGGR